MISKTIGCRGTLFSDKPICPMPPSMAAAAGWAPGARQGIGGSGRTVVVLLAVVEVLAGRVGLLDHRWRFG